MCKHNRPTVSNRFPTSNHLQSRAITRREAEAFMTATTSSTAPTRAKIMRNYALLSGSSCPHLTMAQQARSAGIVFSRALPVSIDLSPSFIASIPSRTPLSATGQESLRARGPRADCLHRRLLYPKAWIQRCRQTTLALADRPDLAHRR
jgi:hypothetical protein